MLILSNLRVRSNLLSTRYQDELKNISVFEAKDVKRRNPNLGVDNHLTDEQRKLYCESLFWGRRRVSLAEDGREAWCESLKDRIPDAVQAFEERPQLEDGFELLVVVSQLAKAIACPFQQDAIDWTRRVRKVLTTRDEFGFTSDMIDQRLEQLLGNQVVKQDSVDLEEKAGRETHIDGSALCSREYSPWAEVPIEAEALECSELPTKTHPSADHDPDLIRLCQCWPDLPPHIKATIVTLINTVSKHS